MESLVQAATDFLAAVLGMLGFVGRPRRRAGIREDLDVLARLRDSPDFGPRSRAYGFLFDQVTREVARYSGVELERKRKIPWTGIVFASLVGLPLAYLTYKLDRNGFNWISLLPAGISATMLLAILGMVFGDEEAPHDPDARRGKTTPPERGATNNHAPGPAVSPRAEGAETRSA